METTDTIALGALGISFIALILSIINRSRDQTAAREENIRTNVLQLFVTADEAGLRSVLAMNLNDPNPSQLQYLERTAVQLRVVGETKLGAQLGELCRSWPSDSSQSREDRRKEFLEYAEFYFSNPK